jgi:hypothetical protein
VYSYLSTVSFIPLKDFSKLQSSPHSIHFLLSLGDSFLNSTLIMTSNSPKSDSPAANGPQIPIPSFDREDPDQQKLSSILQGFRKDDPTSCISLGQDGVLRNLTGDREVINAKGLSPELITAMQNRLPPTFHQDFEGVDGSKVPKEEWFSPDKSLLPEALTEEKKRKAIESWAKYRKTDNKVAHCEKECRPSYKEQ